jgi:hypothetical protein
LEKSLEKNGSLPPALKASSAPSFTKIQVLALNKKLKDACSTTTAAAVTAAASDRGGRFAAARLSLLWAAFSLAQLPWWRME